APDPSQGETPAAPAAAPNGTVEPFPRERRGPMRPAQLTPVRKRMAGWTLGVIFRLADVSALLAIGLSAARPHAIWPPASLVPFAAGVLVAAWSLAIAHAYDFTPREGLVRHLAKVVSGFVLAALVFDALFTGFRLAATDLPHFLRWYGAS